MVAGVDRNRVGLGGEKMKLKKFIEEISPWASVASLCLGIYWHFYPMSLMATTGFQVTDTSSVSTLLIIIGLLLLLFGKRKKK